MDEFVVSVPGKVILFGEHAVLFGKTAVAASLNLRTRLKIRRLDAVVKVRFPQISFEKSWPIEEINEIFDQWPKDLRGNNKPPTRISDDSLAVLKKHIGCEDPAIDSRGLAPLVFLALYFGIASQEGKTPVGLEIVASSELPIGSGLGSSASFSACLVTSLLYLNGAINADINVEPDLVLEDLDLINKWTYMAETIFHGTASGIDNSISTYGGILKFQKGKITTLAKKLNLKILLINTKVPRKTKTLVASTQALHKHLPEIVNPILDAIGAIAENACLILTKMDSRGLDETQYEVLEKLISLNEPLLEALGAGHPRLNKICQLAAEFGLHAKLTGAGGGGCAFVLLGSGNKSASNLVEKLESDGFQCWETTIGGSGIQIESFNPV